MPKLHRIGPEEAAKLIEDGHIYVDVRSEEEFEEGHIPGSFNVPLLHRLGGEMIPNPDFVGVVQAAFPIEKPMILGCRAGARSLRAAELLHGAGYDELWELRTGWDGARDAFGRLDPGWVRKGLPVSEGSPEGFCYPDIKRRALDKL